jgi:HSP20 family protein
MASWDMFRELDSLRREIDAAFRGVGNGRLSAPAFLSGGGRFPQVNLRDDENHLYVDALIPGVDPNALEMTVMGNTLTLAGERKGFDPAVQASVWHRNERGVGRFQRSIELPGAIDNGSIAASCRNGVLTVTVNKAESAKPKKIAVTVS